MKAWGQFGGLAIVVGMTTGLLPAVLTWAEPVSPQVIINELAWAGSTDDPNDEWVELRNLEDRPIDIGGWELTKKISDREEVMTTIPLQCHDQTVCEIPSLGYFLIAKYGADESSLVVEPDMLGGTDFKLVNNNLQIKLYNGSKDSGAEVVDVADDGAGTPPAGNPSSPKSSMERNDEVADGQLETSWHDALASIGFDSGVTDLGTPKSANSKLIEPPIIESITPHQAEVDSQLNIEGVVGENFSVDGLPMVELKLAGQTLAATGVHVANPTLIDAGKFDLSDAPTGRWDLVVTNPNGQTATLPQAVEIVEPPKQYDLTTTARLNEIYPQPNTTANDEYIELYNFGDKTINLEGWVIDDVRDGGSSPFTIGTRTILPKTYLTLYKPETKLTLNDNGDSVYLLQPNGFELDRASYADAPRGQTWARFDDGWQWTTTPSPNGKNVLSSPPAEVLEPTPTEELDDPAPNFRVGDILITELLPNPADDEEFIELQNVSSAPINLKDWTLQDKTKHKYRISQFAVNIQTAGTLVIQPQQYIVITDTMSGIALNNSGGEIVTLADPAGKVIATATYPDKAPTSAAYALAGGVWTWSLHPTPGGVNVLGLDEADEPPPNIEVVLPDELPITGSSPRWWWGMGLVGFAMGAVVCWYYVFHRYKKLSRHPSLGRAAG